MKVQALAIVSLLLPVLAGAVQLLRGSSLLRVHSDTLEQVNHLKQLIDASHWNNVDFKVHSRKSDKSSGIAADIIIPPKLKSRFLAALKQRGLEAEILSNDLLGMVKRYSQRAPNNASVEKHYLPPDQLEDFLNKTQAENPQLVKIQRRGRTHEGRSISFVQIGTCETCPTIVIEAGIHAREWLATAVALNLIDKLVKLDPNHPYLINVTWFIVPSANPDGYAFTHTDAENRFWRKNRRPGSKTGCKGVDLNRNFDFKWGEDQIYTSSDPCNDSYHGPSVGSEPETQALVEFVQTNAHQIKSYFAVHSYSQLIEYACPTEAECETNGSEVKQLAKKFVAAIKNQSGEIYRAGAPGIIHYFVTGASNEWVRFKHDIPLSYAVEVRPKRNTFKEVLDHFNPGPEYIRPTSEEMWAAFRVVADHMLTKTIEK